MKRISQAPRLGKINPDKVCDLENADISEEEKKEITHTIYSVFDEIEAKTTEHDYLIWDNVTIADIQIYITRFLILNSWLGMIYQIIQTQLSGWRE